MFELTFKNIYSLLYQDVGADSKLDYIGQTTYMMFLKYLLELKYKVIVNDTRVLVAIKSIREALIGFQGTLYKDSAG